jgi:hypothetical protein
LRQSFAGLPPNDLCANAISISNGTLINGYVTNATQSEPACDATPVANDVWYSFTTGSSTTSVIVNANTTVTGTDIVLQAYSGACGALTAMIPTTSSGTGANGCVDGPAAGLETATYTVTPSTTYYVRVYGYNTAQGTFNIQLVIPPSNNNCANATNVPFNTVVSANTAGATMDNPSPGYLCWSSSNDDDIWYTFTTPAAMSTVNVTMNVTNYTWGGSATDPQIGYGLFTACTGSADVSGGGCQFAATSGTGSFTFNGLAGNTTYKLALLTPGTGVFNAYNFYLTFGFPLAIKLGNISATNVGSRNRVDWNTESELIGDKFEVERSADGRNFTYMGTVNAKGTASAYSYWDEIPVTGVNHYRLKMYDAAGNYTYSKVVTANVKTGAFTVEAYPNPVSDLLTVKVYGSSASNPTVSISDATGKVVKVVAVVNNEAKIDMSGMAHGMYLVKYSDNNHTQTIKVNKQ